MATEKNTNTNSNGGRNLVIIVTLMIAFLGVGAAVVSTMTGSNNAQVLLLQEQQRIEKEARTDQAVQLQRQLDRLEERLERIEERSVAATADLDIVLQREIELVNATIIQRINDLDAALQKELAATQRGQDEDNIRERTDAVRLGDFEARLRVLERLVDQ